MDKNIVVTKHGYVRMKERLGLSKAASDRMAQKVYNDGMSKDATKGDLCKFIRKVEKINPRGSECKIYGHYIYFFSSGNGNAKVVLVTVYELPTDRKKIVPKRREGKDDGGYASC